VLRARDAGNATELTQARTRLWRLLTKLQGILDETEADDRQQHSAQQLLAQHSAQREGA
jgi:hypothetical protein